MMHKLIRTALFVMLIMQGNSTLGYAENPIHDTTQAGFWQPISLSLPADPSTNAIIQQIDQDQSDPIYNIYKYRTYERGNGIRVNDLNQDGWKDVIFITNSYSLRIWLQNPSCHQLQEWKTFILDFIPLDLEIVDVDRDGKKEIIVLGIKTFDFEMGTGIVQIIHPFREEFSDAENLYLVGLGPRKLKVGDINNDSRIDILVTSKSVLDVLVQKADGSFDLQPVISPVLPENESANDLAVGDFNNDSLLDVAVQVIHRPSSILLYYQSVGFLLPGISYEGPFGSSMTSGDVTGDGKVDLIMVHTYNYPLSKAVVFAQKTAGGFDSGATYQTYDLPVSPNVADMNRDGRQDLVLIHTGWGAFSTHYQNTDGTLSEAVTRPVGDAQQYYPFQNFAAVGDVTGDKYPDVVYLGINDGLVMVAQGLAPYCPVSIPQRAPLPQMLYGVLNDIDADEVVSGDVNGDGLDDFLALIRFEVQIIFQIPGGDFSLGPSVPLSDIFLYGLSVGDLNGDGRLDIAAASYEDWGGLFISYQKPDGSFPAPDIILDAPHPIQTHIADWSGDGKDDLLALAENGIKIYEQTADGSLAGPTIYAEGLIGNTMISQIADWNNDGRLDLIAWWTTISDTLVREKQVRVFLREEDGSFSLLPKRRYEEGGGIAAGDINGDGKTDIVFSASLSRPEGRLVLFYQQADGTPSERVILSDWEFNLPGAISIGDLNFDGLNDILVMNRAGSLISIFTQNKTHIFDAVLFTNLSLTNGKLVNAFAKVDTDGDDIPDVIVMATGDGFLLFLKLLPADNRVYHHTFLPATYRIIK